MLACFSVCVAQAFSFLPFRLDHRMGLVAGVEQWSGISLHGGEGVLHHPIGVKGGNNISSAQETIH